MIVKYLERVLFLYANQIGEMDQFAFFIINFITICYINKYKNFRSICIYR
jgi:hypothetical protein